jgi:uncharacterized protein (TIGR02757 family)
VAGGYVSVTKRSRRQQLPGLLEQLLERYGGLEHIDSDPLRTVLPFSRSEDREVVAFLAASLSFGNVKAILGGIESVLRPLGAQPSQQLQSWSHAEAMAAAAGFRYRWIHDVDMGGLYVALGETLRREGTLERLFAQGMGESDANILGGASALIHGLRSRLPPAVAERRGARFLLADPDGSGASKRLHMFLRWMIRAESPDLGLWHSATPRQLLMPLDTHVARISRYIGLTARTQVDRRAVLEVTESLRSIHPEDPTRYDFALARLGILGQCPHRREQVRCAPCDLYSVCTL